MADRVRVGRQTAQNQFERKALYAEDVVTDNGVSVENHIDDLWTAIQGGGIEVPLLTGRVTTGAGEELSFTAGIGQITVMTEEGGREFTFGMNTAIYDGQELVISRW